MGGPVPPVSIVEYFVQHPRRRPLHRMLAPATPVIETIFEALLAYCTDVITEGELARFPRLVEWMSEELAAALSTARQSVHADVLRYVETEEAYVYTEDPVFLREWGAASQKAATATSPAALRSILSAYGAVVAEAACAHVPKIVVRSILAALHALPARLHERLRLHPRPHELLQEESGAEAARRELQEVIASTAACARAIDAALGAPDAA